jgi:hypothetical protein
MRLPNYSDDENPHVMMMHIPKLTTVAQTSHLLLLISYHLYSW